MKRKIMLFVALPILLVWAVHQLGQAGEMWVRPEESGVKYRISYLHELAEESPEEAKLYIGRPVTFVAPLQSVGKDLDLPYYGRISVLLRFSGSGERIFLVDAGSAEEESWSGQTGEMLKVRGRITEISPGCVMLLNVVGTPGWPNDIRIEKVK